MNKLIRFTTLLIVATIYVGTMVVIGSCIGDYETQPIWEWRGFMLLFMVTGIIGGLHLIIINKGIKNI